jgi:hypothetical protein
MTLAAKLINLFPLSAALVILASFINLCRAPSVAAFLIFIFSAYLFPLISYRIHNLLFPLKKGAFDLSKKEYNPWWGTFKIQEIYLHLSFLESLLQTVPGLFSLWLRLWGSKIGRGIVWTPNIEVTDRAMMEIGDNVVFGHRSTFLCHVITPKTDKVLLIVDKIIIQDNAFIGAGSKLGPGVVVEQEAILSALSIGLPRQTFKKSENL